ncbi:MAG: hypothetical protein JXA57_14490 [Armatimonadetes bacterium]|nr:hypothetical protein [Armatimonadota bacterium]
MILVEQNARMALDLAETAYVLETGRTTMHGDASGLAQDPKIIASYLGG